MPKINNTTQYPKRTSSDLNINDFAIGTSGTTGATINIPIVAMTAAIINNQIIEATLSSASTYQNDKLVGASGYLVWFAGDEGVTSGLAASLNSQTGTVTFDNNLAPLTGSIKILYW